MNGIEWSAIDWTSLIVLSIFVLFAARVGERLSFGSRALAAFLTAVTFGLGFALWSYGLDDTLKQVIATVAPIPQS
jgi:hypothetical protein